MEEFRIHVIDIRYLSLLLKQKKFQQKDFLRKFFFVILSKFSLSKRIQFSITLLLCFILYTRNDSHPFRSLSLYRFFLLGKKTWWKNSFVHVEFISKNYKSIIYIYTIQWFLKSTHSKYDSTAIAPCRSIIIEVSKFDFYQEHRKLISSRLARSWRAIIKGQGGQFTIEVYNRHWIHNPHAHPFTCINRHIRGWKRVSIGPTWDRVVVCARCSLAKLERFTAAGPLQFSSIRSDHRPWSRARFLSGIVEPISTDRPGHVLPSFSPCLYLYPPTSSSSFLRFFFSILDPDFFRSLIPRPWFDSLSPVCTLNLAFFLLFFL